MQIKTLRAKSIQEALQLIRTELGPDAAVLHTREVRRGLLGRMILSRRIEVTASNEVNVQPPLTLAAQNAVASQNAREQNAAQPTSSVDTLMQTPAPAHAEHHRDQLREDIQAEIQELRLLVEKLHRRSDSPISDASHPAPVKSDDPREQAFFTVFTEMRNAGLHEQDARDLLDAVRPDCGAADSAESIRCKVAETLASELLISGPLEVTPGKCTVAAFVGPTGVGKTTTIAKLAAVSRLHHKHRVGLITVDTYRIAAVEQLRTYANIIALPMEVVATPREMRQAIARMRDLDLVLIDTAGRSPQDDARLQELQSMLAEAHPDETMLVLSCVSSTENLQEASRRFAEVGVNRLVLTKLDEAVQLGAVLPALRGCQLPVSYLTDGQNVPDDIQEAEARFLADAVLGESFSTTQRSNAA